MDEMLTVGPAVFGEGGPG